MGGSKQPPIQPLPPPPPDQADPAVLEARRRRKQQAQAAAGREGTILTGPSGLEKPSSLGGKTVLGSY